MGELCVDISRAHKTSHFLPSSSTLFEYHGMLCLSMSLSVCVCCVFVYFV